MASTVVLVAMFPPLRRLMTETLAAADFSSVGFRIKDHRAVVRYAPVGVNLLLTIPTAVTMAWYIDWRLSPLAALVIVMVVMVLGWRSYVRAVGGDHKHMAQKKIDRHVKDQKARMRERYKQR